jgi:hypothetical protein
MDFVIQQSDTLGSLPTVGNPGNVPASLTKITLNPFL